MYCTWQTLLSRATVRLIKFQAAAAAAEGVAANEETKVVSEAVAGSALDEFRAAPRAAGVSSGANGEGRGGVQDQDNTVCALARSLCRVATKRSHPPFGPDLEILLASEDDGCT